MAEIIEKWSKEAQPFELKYWETKGLSDYSDEDFFKEWWDNIFNWIGEIEGEVLDIGSGIRPVFNRGYVIEPLGNEYSKIKPEWWKNVILYSEPAEKFIPEIENKIDFILSWNSIDHGYDWKEVLNNIERYLKKDGTVVIATDCKTEQIGVHPILGANKEEFIKEIEKRFDILKRIENFADREIAFILKKK
jgi:SAM-dependent methyltransferase